MVITKWYCFQCKSFKNETNYMEKFISPLLQEVIWFCKVCDHFEIICDWKTAEIDSKGNSVRIEPYPVSVYAKYLSAGLPIKFDRRYSSAPVVIQRELITEKEWVDSAYDKDKWRL